MIINETLETSSLPLTPMHAADTQDPKEKKRVDRLVELVDHCTAAKAIAEAMNDHFLVYMLSITIQAARTEMRPKALQTKM